MIEAFFIGIILSEHPLAVPNFDPVVITFDGYPCGHTCNARRNTDSTKGIAQKNRKTCARGDALADGVRWTLIRGPALRIILNFDDVTECSVDC